MIVTFTSKVSADIIMFGDVARQLLKMMGHSGTVPGAMQARDLPAALQRLEQALAKYQPAEPIETDEADDEPPFKPDLRLRALPLVNLLKAAIAGNADIMWDS